jgi:hypothetical protein
MNLKLIPTVILTTSEAEMDIEKCFDLRANSYLCKPMDLGPFDGLVRSVNDFWLTKSISPDHYMVLGSETQSVRASTWISSACRKCSMTMGLGAIRPHPFAAHMESHTFLFTRCNRTVHATSHGGRASVSAQEVDSDARRARSSHLHSHSLAIKKGPANCRALRSKRLGRRQ